MTYPKDRLEEEAKVRDYNIQTIEALLKEGSDDKLIKFLNGIEPEDIAGFLCEFDLEEKICLFNFLDKEHAAVVLDDTDPQTRLQILKTLNSENLASVLEEMPIDEAADVIEEVSENRREDLLELMEKEDAEDVEEILSYPEESAGRLMTTDLVSVKYEDDVSDAINLIRQSPIDEEFFFVYVVDSDMRLMGVVSLKKFLIAPKGTLIKDIMEKDIHSVAIDADQEQAAEIMKKYDIFSLPVVDKDGRLAGRITADDIIDVIDEEHAEDLSMMTGTIEEESGHETTISATKNRLPWLVTCMLGSILTGLVIQFFEVTLGELIALVSFIPVITATGGNSGVQASTVVVRGIALGYLDFGKLGEELWRQFKIAVTLGVTCGLLLTLLASSWKGNNLLGLITGSSIFLVVVWSNFVGVFIPIMFKKIKIDPALASGPLITTLNDIVGVFIYLSVASALLR